MHIPSEIFDFLKSEGACPTSPPPRNLTPPELDAGARVAKSGVQGEDAVLLDLAKVRNPVDVAPLKGHTDRDYREVREFGAWIDAAEPMIVEGSGFEAVAWYNSITFNAENAGVVVLLSGIRCWAHQIQRQSQGQTGPLEAWRASFRMLQLHEQFHHQVEMEAIRIHLLTGSPVYRRYSQRVYDAHRHPLDDNLLEEGLAVAYSIRRLRQSSPAAAAAMADVAPTFAPGYRTASKYLEDANFARGYERLMRCVAQGRLVPESEVKLTSKLGTPPKFSGNWLDKNTIVVRDCDSIPFLP